jgi:hypothetical protein
MLMWIVAGLLAAMALAPYLVRALRNPQGSSKLRTTQKPAQSTQLGEILDRRIERGAVIVRRETAPDGGERIIYRGCLP